MSSFSIPQNESAFQKHCRQKGTTFVDVYETVAVLYVGASTGSRRSLFAATGLYIMIC